MLNSLWILKKLLKVKIRTSRGGDANHRQDFGRGIV